ncbi:Hypothetical protein D9617_1g087130 [Elsinoe fawcettii]|nr:Hypothetical protein D9617_1g087130 [Elsinoe fawcettii]
MSTVVAAPPATVTTLGGLSGSPPKDRSSPLLYPGPPRSMSTSSREGAPLAPHVNASPNITSAPRAQRLSPQSNGSPESAARSPPSRTASDGKASPNAQRTPLIRVKKEPASPQMSSRPRPRRLDLSNSSAALRGPQTAGANPLPSKESAGLAIKDLGVACLSPGFQTQDPTLREQLQRSLSVRDQQRQLIEARQKGSTKPLTASAEASQRIDDGPATSRRKGPPPGLSIHAPSASAFAHERVIQSAPLGQSFTGLRQHNQHPHPPSHLAHSSHVHHVPAQQTANRLPPISDVFAHDRMEAPPSASFRPAGPPAPSPGHPPMQSPGFPPQHHQAQPSSSRAREFRSAEEAVQSMAGGREELLPKVVHYGGAQPPTPPSPGNHHHPQHHPGERHASYSHHPHHPQHHPQAHHYDSRPDLARTHSISGRRRTREEYERDNGGSPAIHGGEFKRHAPGREEDDWRHGMSSREKKEEFMRLCERAWDLFHS